MSINRLLSTMLVMVVTVCSLSAEFYDYNLIYEGPLEPDSWDAEVRAGINPIMFADRRPFFLVVATPEPGEGRIAPWFNSNHFLDMFNTPWIVSGQVNYNVSTNSQVFYEFSYTHAEGKQFIQQAQVHSLPFSTAFKFSSFSQLGVYLGHRFFFNPVLSDLMHGYFGHKIGLAHYKDVCAHMIRADPITPLFGLGNAVIYEKQTVVSGGLILGIDYYINDRSSFVIQVEVVASGALENSIDRISFEPTDGDGLNVSNIIVGKTGTVVGFPLSLGFSWSW